MKLTRKQFIGGAGIAGLGMATSGCGEAIRHAFPPALQSELAELAVDADAWRVLNRVTWGPSPTDLLRIHDIGIDPFIEEQLAPESIAENHGCSLRLGVFDTLEMGTQDARDLETANYPEVGRGQAAVELQQAAVIRSTYSSRQLYELMADFWTNHFNVSQLKADCSWLKTVDDRLMRKHTLGRFQDLVRTSAQSPAMLFYLDNRENQKRNPETGAGPNENYARELLELHTLGIDGGYSLRDIQEAARCFTGWSYADGLTWEAGRFAFEQDRHDDGRKRVLGTLIPPGGGRSDGERVIELACRHPATSRHIARKLTRRFLGEGGDDSLEQKAARAFARSNGDIRQVLSVILHSREVRSRPLRQLKRPLEFVASALRATAASSTCAAIPSYLEQMGQLPYHWPMPDGYPSQSRAWAPGLLPRWNFALDLAHGKIPGTGLPLDELIATREGAAMRHSMSALTLGAPLPADVERRFARSAASLSSSDRGKAWLALALSSPQFQWR